MEKIKSMISAAPTFKDAKDILSAMRLVGTCTEAQFQEGQRLIRAKFAKPNYTAALQQAIRELQDEGRI
jgi:hypothetical protein